MTDETAVTVYDEDDWIRKINFLLKKAEGTDNKHESDAFYAKAHELMMKHAIDEQRARADFERLHGRRGEEPIIENFMFSSYAHHREAKQRLVEVVCDSQHVRYFHYDNRKYSNKHEPDLAEANRGLNESQWTKLIGYKSDIEAVKMLYVSLLIQSQRFANEDWKDRYGDAKITGWEDGWVGKFTWLSGHMEGFAEEIGRRFKEVTDSIYEATAGANALIIDKDANILEWMYEHGILRRPVERTHRTCWALQPMSDPSWPLTVKGEPNRKHRALYCIKQVPIGEETHEGPHEYNYDTGRYKSSYYVSKGGRQKSYEGMAAGRTAARSADIGLTRTGSGAARLRG